LEHHSNRAGSHSTPPTIPEQATVYFDFINLEQPKCIVDMRGSECVKYCAVINLLLFLNGFIYSMLFSINSSIPIVKARTQPVGMVSACYVGAGILSPTIGCAILLCVGLKATIATSLAISCVGTLIFWPCGAVGSYPGFVVGNIMVGASLGIMEIVASTFNSLCGPPSYATARILIGTGLEAVGGTLSSVLATKILAIHVEDAHNLVAMQGGYLIIALFTVLLGLLYWYVPLPHVMEPELRTRPGILAVDPSEKHLGVVPVIVVSLGIAALSSFCAAGALASLRTSIGSVLSLVSNRTKTALEVPISDFQTSLTAVYAASQFLFAFLSLFIHPSVILLSACGTGIALAAVISSVAFPSAAMVQQVTLALSILLGGIPSMVVAIALRGLGWWTAPACGLLISSCSLGAGIWPWVMLAVSINKSAQYAYCIVVALFAVCGVFPLYLRLVRSARGRERPPGWGFIGAVF
jgi:fucose permease